MLVPTVRCNSLTKTNAYQDYISCWNFGVHEKWKVDVVCYLDTFLDSAPISWRIWKHTISARWLANPNCAHSHFPHIFQSLYMWVPDSLSWWWLSCSLSGKIHPPIMLTNEPSTVYWFAYFEHAMYQSLLAHVILVFVLRFTLSHTSLKITNERSGCAKMMSHGSGESTSTWSSWLT